MVFSSAGMFGSNVFLRAYHDLPIPEAQRTRAIARWLDVSAATVSAWLAGRRCPPRAVVLALWLESCEGRAYLHTDLANEARRFAALARSLQDAMAAQARTIDALRAEVAELKARGVAGAAANDCAFLDAAPPLGAAQARAL